MNREMNPMKRLGLTLALGFSAALAVWTAPAAQAQVPFSGIDERPAATLLLPYFEVNLKSGATTLFSLNNSSATAVLAHVTVWSDQSVPVLGFNVYLTGYDVQTVDLGALIRKGTLPATASNGQDPGDQISPKGGPHAQDINFASCGGQLPFTQLPKFFITHVQSSLTGGASTILGNRCAGFNHKDRIARGYVTIDTVSNCTLRYAGDPGYFISGGFGDATNQNVLWGDYYYQNGGVSAGDPLVHVHASATDPETSVPGEYTFYGRYVAWTAADNREPLSAISAARYIRNGAYKTPGTTVVAWRDPKVNQGTLNCSNSQTPPWYPLGQEQLVVFDEQEHPFVPPTIPVFPQPPSVDPLPFPLATQRTSLVQPGEDFVAPPNGVLPVPFSSGFLYLNLSTTVPAAGSNPPEDPGAAQSWVFVSHDSKGKFSAGYQAVQLSNARKALHTFIGF